MKKSNILAALAAAALITSSGANAAGGIKKCYVAKCEQGKDAEGKCVDWKGDGFIKAGAADCASAKSATSCAGSNGQNDASAWLVMPEGLCKMLNKGDVSKASDGLKKKLDVERLEKAFSK